ncbi:MAG: hypothetical protein JWM80_5391 [Cyanobacteria bacterium RYN_339]|nr:hypothetical protein [Cyanobacteria bacterium RYN_339]
MLAEDAERRAWLVLDPAGGPVAVRVEGVGRDVTLSPDKALARLAPYPRLLAALALGLGRLPDARAACEAAVAQADPAELPADLLALAAVALEQGDLAAADTAARRGSELAANDGRRLEAGMGLAIAAEVASYQDGPGRADALIGTALEALWAAGLHEASAEALARWGWALLRGGRTSGLPELLAKLRGLVGEQPYEPLARLAAASTGDVARLRELTAAARAEHQPLRLAELLRWIGGPAELEEAARLARANGQGRLAAELDALLRPRSGADAWCRLAGHLTAISAEQALPAACRRVARALVELTGAERGFLLRYEGFAIVDVCSGASQLEAFATDLADQVAWSGQPVYVPDLREQSNLAVGGEPVRAALAVPVRAGQELVGVLIADSRRPLPGSAEEAMAIAAALAEHAAGAIVAHRRRELAEAAAAEQAVAARMALAAARAGTLEALLPAVRAEAEALCGADRVVVLLGSALAAVEPGAAYSRTIARWVYEQRQPLHLLDPRADKLFNAQASVRDLGGRTLDLAPILHRGDVLGVLYTDHPYDALPRPGGLAGLMRVAEALGALLARCHVEQELTQGGAGAPAVGQPPERQGGRPQQLDGRSATDREALGH